MTDLLLRKKEHLYHKHWAEILWNMAGEDMTQYESLRRTDVNEFFYLFDAYSKNIELKIKKHGLANNNQKNGR